RESAAYGSSNSSPLTGVVARALTALLESGIVRRVMHFGIFVEERRRGSSEAAAFQDAVELTEAAEAGGLDGVWRGEIHLNPNRSVQSVPMTLAGFLAARTTRVRIGTAVTVLPLVHPLRIAEEVATVDHLSQGRFDFGIGRSGAATTYDTLGIPY